MYVYCINLQKEGNSSCESFDSDSVNKINGCITQYYFQKFIMFLNYITDTNPYPNEDTPERSFCLRTNTKLAAKLKPVAVSAPQRPAQ